MRLSPALADTSFPAGSRRQTFTVARHNSYRRKHLPMVPSACRSTAGPFLCPRCPAMRPTLSNRWVSNALMGTRLRTVASAYQVGNKPGAAAQNLTWPHQ